MLPVNRLLVFMCSVYLLVCAQYQVWIWLVRTPLSTQLIAAATPSSSYLSTTGISIFLKILPHCLASSLVHSLGEKKSFI